MIDIRVKKDLLLFLESAQVFGKGIDLNDLCLRYFDSGVSATVAMVTSGGKSVIVKQALAKLKVQEEWQCDQSRMAIEQAALTVYSGIVPDCIPAPLYYDAQHFIMVREAAPESCRNWKQQLLDGLIDFRVAERAIDALSTIHDRTAGNMELARAFGNSRFFYDLRVNPYIEQVAKKHPSIAHVAASVAGQLMEEHVCLIHGDYSPKNMLVDDREIYILDYEVSYYGHPGFDVAFFINHFLLKAIKNRQWQDAYLNMLLWTTQRYFSAITLMDPAELERQTVRMLGLLLLARVDGKSPAEYITVEADKRAARDLSFAILGERPETCRDVVRLFRMHVH